MMFDALKDILHAPLDSPVLFIISIAYLLIESICTYDTRIMQGFLRNAHSDVFERAEMRMLPRWVAHFVYLGWLLLIVIAILNWKYAIALYVVKFILKVMPVLELVGEQLMRSHLSYQNAREWLDKNE